MKMHRVAWALNMSWFFQPPMHTFGNYSTKSHPGHYGQTRIKVNSEIRSHFKRILRGNFIFPRFIITVNI